MSFKCLHPLLYQVQYPGLQRQFATDIATMAFLSKALAWVLFLSHCIFLVVP